MFNLRKTDSGLLYQRCEIDFGNIHEYIKNYTQSGDYIIPLCGNHALAMECNYNNSIAKEDEDYIHEYDDRLFKIYRHQDDDLVLKNTKKIASKDPKKKGLLFNIMEIIEKCDQMVEKIPQSILKKIVENLQKFYDDRMIDKFTGTILETHIWIPVWAIQSETAIVITLYGRVNLIFT